MPEPCFSLLINSSLSSNPISETFSTSPWMSPIPSWIKFIPKFNSNKNKNQFLKERLHFEQFKVVNVLASANENNRGTSGRNTVDLNKLKFSNRELITQREHRLPWHVHPIWWWSRSQRPHCLWMHGLDPHKPEKLS